MGIILINVTYLLNHLCHLLKNKEMRFWFISNLRFSIVSSANAQLSIITIHIAI